MAGPLVVYAATATAMAFPTEEGKARKGMRASFKVSDNA